MSHLFGEPFTRHHRALAGLLDREAMLLVLAFRGWGKSTFVTYAETLRLLVLGEVDFAVLTSRTEAQTWPLVLQLRLEFEENARLRQDFGPFARGPVWQANRFAVSGIRVPVPAERARRGGSAAQGRDRRGRIVARSPSARSGPESRHGAALAVSAAPGAAGQGAVEVMGRSLGSSTRGPRSLANRRPQLWVLDDLQELKDGKNPERTEDILSYLTGTVMPAMSAARNLIRVVGTKMSEDCAVARLEADPRYARFRLDAQSKDGAPAEPERFPRSFLDRGPASRKALMGSDAYAREYLNTAASRSGLVRRAWIRFYRRAELNGRHAGLSGAGADSSGGPLPLACATFWDPALAPGGDFKAIVTLGCHVPTGRIYVLEAFVRRDASPDEQAAEFCRQWERVARDPQAAGALGYEANGFQSLLEYPVEAHREARGLPPLPVQAVTNTLPKELRVAAMAPLFERGAVFFLEDDEDQRRLADQWVFWPKGGKDGPDAMRGAWDLLQRLATPAAPLVAARQRGPGEEMVGWR